MREMIHERRTLGKTADRFDLFGLLIDANEESGLDGSAVLTDNELLGLIAFLPWHLLKILIL